MSRYCVSAKGQEPLQAAGHRVYKLLGEANGCVAGCRTGISVYDTSDYAPPGVHPHQEGFFVLEGTGLAKVGDDEFRIEPEMSFLVPAGTQHCIRRDRESGPLRVFWFHAAA